MLPEIPRDLRRILAIRLDNIGDVIMLSPALRELRRAYPQAHLTLMASPAGASVAPLLPWLDDVIPWRAVWQEIRPSFDGGPEKERALVDMLSAGRYDAALIFTSFAQSPHPPAYACYLAGIPLRAAQSKEFGGHILTHWVRPEQDSTYQVDRNLHLLRSLDIEIKDARIELRVPQPAQNDAAQLLGSVGILPGDLFVLAAPGASAAARRYDPARFAQVCAILTRQTGLPILAVGTGKERALMQPFFDLAATNTGLRLLVGQTSVQQMAALIQRSALVLANNSASIHMAEAFNRPMVIFYSGTETLEQWSPRYTPAKILNRPVACSPCYAFQCPYEMQCLDISPQEAASAALAFWKQLSAGRQTGAWRATQPIGENA